MGAHVCYWWSFSLPSMKRLDWSARPPPLPCEVWGQRLPCGDPEEETGSRSAKRTEKGCERAARGGPGWRDRGAPLCRTVPSVGLVAPGPRVPCSLRLSLLTTLLWNGTQWGKRGAAYSRLNERPSRPSSADLPLSPSPTPGEGTGKGIGRPKKGQGV